MYKSWLYNLFIVVLLLAINPLHAQKESKLNRLKETLTSKVIYFKQCLLGDIKCSTEEIWQVRRNLGIATAVLGVIAGTGAVYYKGWNKKIQIEFIKLAQKTIAFISNPKPQKEKNAQEELRDVINKIKSDLPPDAQKQITIVEAQLQQQKPAATVPSTSAITVPDDPAEQIKKQLAILHSGLELFLQNPNDKTLEAFQDIYKAYLMTIAAHKNINLDAILILSIGDSGYSGKSLLAKVKETRSKAPEIIREALPSEIQKAVGPKYKTVVTESNILIPFIKNAKQQITAYTTNTTDANLIEMHFALLDLQKTAQGAPPTMFLSKETLDPISQTGTQFFALVSKDKSLLQRLKTYPGYEHTTQKSLEGQFRRIAKKKEVQQKKKK